MFKRLTKKLLNILFQKSLPVPSKLELENLSEFRRSFSNLPTMEIKNVEASEIAWIKNMNRLKDLAMHQNPRKFLRWDVIGNTMFIADAKYILKELKYLKSLNDWEIRWRSAIKESFVGYPVPYKFHPQSSGSLIHYAYHIAQYEEKTRTMIQHMDFIFEFGGGYGGICKLFHKLGFQGKYLIFDLPHFSILQNYYLKTHDFPMLTINEFNKSRQGVLCISNKDVLKEIIMKHTQTNNKMFLATWSISETPVKIRNMIFPLVSDFHSFLIAYQDKFEEVNNLDFFSNWIKTMTHVTWHNEMINHIQGSNYLIGNIKKKLT